MLVLITYVKYGLPAKMTSIKTIIQSSRGGSLYKLSVTVPNFQKYIVFLSQNIDFVLAKTVYNQTDVRCIMDRRYSNLINVRRYKTNEQK